MSKKFLTHVDLAKNELQNGVIHNLAAAPASPAKGQLYMNTSDNTLYWWDGTAWQSAKAGAGFPGYGSVVPETSFGGSSADGVATTVSRSDHKHANPLHDNAAHSTIPLNVLAVPTGPVSMNGQKITSLADGTAATDAVTKSQLDNVSAGLSWKTPVRAATTANITLSAPQTIDGVSVIAGDRVLVKNQTTASANGIYVVAAGAWTRATDADTATELLNAACFVSEGTQADTAWVGTANAPITVGTTNLPFVQFAGTTGSVPPSRLINTTAPLTGGGDLSADRTLGITAATDTATGAIELATQAEATTGTDTTRAITPATLNGVIAANVNPFLARRFAVDVGGATSQVITHNLATLDTIIQVYRKASPFDQVECDVEHTTINTATLRFTVAPAAAEYRAVVLA